VVKVVAVAVGLAAAAPRGLAADRVEAGAEDGGDTSYALFEPINNKMTFFLEQNRVFRRTS